MTEQEAPKAEVDEEERVTRWMASKVMGTANRPLPEYREFVQKAYYRLEEIKKQRDETRELVRDALRDLDSWRVRAVSRLVAWAKEDDE